MPFFKHDPSPSPGRIPDPALPAKKPNSVPKPVPSPVYPADKPNPVPKPSLRAVITYRPVTWKEKYDDRQFDFPANLHTTPYEQISPLTTIQCGRH